MRTLLRRLRRITLDELWVLLAIAAIIIGISLSAHCSHHPNPTESRK